MDSLKEVKKTCSCLGVGYAAFLFVELLLQLEVVLVGGIFIGDANPANGETWLALLKTLPTYVLGTLVCWLIIKDIKTACKPKKQKFGAGRLVVCFLVCIGIMYIGGIIGNVFMFFVNGIQGKPVMNPVNEFVKNLDTWMIVLLMVVMAPVFEELLYRKLLIDRIAQYGDRTAIILSGILFGLSHGNFYQFFYAFGLGAVFAYVYINTGKLRYTIALHAIINFIGSIVALCIADSMWFQAAYLLFMIAGVVMGIALLVIYRREIHLRPARLAIPKARWFNALFVNLGMILFLCVSVGLFLLS